MPRTEMRDLYSREACAFQAVIAGPARFGFVRAGGWGGTVKKTCKSSAEFQYVTGAGRPSDKKAFDETGRA